MEAYFDINKVKNCQIEIVSSEKKYHQYQDENDLNLRKRTYKYSQSVTINVINSQNSDGEETRLFEEVIPHISMGPEFSTFNLTIDGIHEITHIILPTEAYADWVSSESKLEGYEYLYFFDTQSKEFKLRKSGYEDLVVELEEILNINATNNTTIIKKDLILFNTCVLAECLYRLNRNMLSNFCGKCINKLDYSKLDIFNRDFIWMSINVIKYLVDMENYIEALRILESLSECGGICKHVNLNTENHGCCN